jgi:hypothetical protein
VLADLDFGQLHRVSAAVDPLNKLVVWSYPGAGNAGGTPNRMVLFNWAEGRWARAEADVELIHSAIVQSGYTLEELGSVPGGLDALPYSLDSRYWTGAGRFLMGGISTAHRSGFFNGANMAAVVDTMERALFPGRRGLLTGARPIVQGNGPAVTLAPGTRNLPTEPVSWGGAVAANAGGLCPLRADARYHRARLSVAAGGDWSAIQGIDDIEARPAGAR